MEFRISCLTFGACQKQLSEHPLTPLRGDMAFVTRRLQLRPILPLGMLYIHRSVRNAPID